MILIRNIATLIGFVGVSLVNIIVYFSKGWEGIISVFILLALSGVYGSLMEHYFNDPFDKLLKLEKYLFNYVLIWKRLIP